MVNFAELEIKRQKIQAELDSLKTQKERNIMGQFSTPITLANDILKHTANLRTKNTKVRFLDPAFGTGVFFSALNNVFKLTDIETATGYEIDKYYGNPARELWSKTNLKYKIADFTKTVAPNKNKDKFNLIICNPPYVRHHHINYNKENLQALAFEKAQIKISGLAGLYCYFIALAHSWMQINGIACWLIPSEFMDVNYGQAIKEYLLNEVTLLQVHRFDPNNVQFDDALVSSTIVWFKNKKSSKKHQVKFTIGSSITKPRYEKEISIEILDKETKWTRFPIQSQRFKQINSKLGDFFTIKRGIATGDNKFFIIPLTQIKQLNLPIEYFRPILPSPRYLDESEVYADKKGHPKIRQQLFVLDCKLPIETIKESCPNLYIYLQEGIRKGVTERYLCKNRKIWYAQESRKESIFYCTYIGRSDKKGKNPFRFILNHSKAIVSNSYLILYPKSNLQKQIDANPMLSYQIIKALNQITGRNMIDEGRVYGGGMYKLEPKELSKVFVSDLNNLLD